ncbi:MAG TPA: hypothetical protein VFV38_39845 [Ktedonobacteraceae bacterium]|nr:hypothetical protein [Ktedonobacteraceae bacterium]
MNGQRQYTNRQNNHHQNGNRYQQYNRTQSRKDQLERELHWLERDLVILDAQIDALGEKGRVLEAAKNAHMQSFPWAIAQVALSTIGVKHLPPVARTWYFKHQQYLRSEEALKQHAVTLYYKRDALATQIEHTQIMIDVLRFEL